MRAFYFLICIVVSMMCLGCESEVVDSHQDQTVFRYLFVGHPYELPHTMDARVLPYVKSGEYDQFWLGGDMCAETTERFSTLEYVDDLFDLSSPTTHWALGNHDVRNGHVDWITDKTGRDVFYSESYHGICMIVVNTNFAVTGSYDTIRINEQFDLIKRVCDTVQNVSHLILMSHHASCWAVPGVDSAVMNANADYGFLKWRFNPDERFGSGIYPLLKQVKDRGINVIHLMGDYGQKVNEYYEQSTDGIHFIGSGITSNIPYNDTFPSFGLPDKILIFEHDTVSQELTWHFETL